MTNAEKYLKVSTSEFIEAIIDELIDIGGLSSLENWLVKEAKPTLTKDERVILRNIREKENKYITRDKSGYLYITEKPFSMLALPFSIYNHLFQFIKERRRI